MDSKFDFGPDADDRIVYVRRINSEDLPDELRDRLGGLKTVYSVHNGDGERLALVKDRQLAFVLARQHDLSPVMVH